MGKVYTDYCGTSETEHGLCASLKLGDYLSIQSHKPCSISHFENDFDVEISRDYCLFVFIYLFTILPLYH